MSTKDKKVNKEKVKKEVTKSKDKNQHLKECEDRFLKLQTQYRQLYDEYTLFRQRAQNREREIFMDGFEKWVKVMIRMVEDLYKAISQIPKEMENNSWSKWIKTLIKQFEDMIKNLDIHIEDALGKEVDHLYHEPIWVEKVTDETKKGKIIKQYERWYIYKKGTEEEKVLQPAKVIVWQ